MTIWVKLAAIIALALGLIVSGWVLRGLRDDSVKLAIMQAAEISQQATAKEIAKIKVKNTTIYNKIVEHTFHDPVYQECKHTPEAYQSILELFK